MAGKRRGPYRLCVVVRGAHDPADVVGSDILYTCYERADNARKKLLETEAFRNYRMGKISVVVMSMKTFKRLQEKGIACTMSRIKANQFTRGRRADLVDSPKDLSMQREFVEFENMVKLSLR